MAAQIADQLGHARPSMTQDVDLAVSMSKSGRWRQTKAQVNALTWAYVRRQRLEPEPADNRADLLDVAPCRPKHLYFLGIRRVGCARRCYSAPDVAR
jgi:hypothetical protein